MDNLGLSYQGTKMALISGWLYYWGDLNCRVFVLSR